MSQFARRVDGNHKQFASTFKKLDIPYQDTSKFRGMLDYMVLTRSNRLVRLEVKTGPDEPLTEREREVFEKFPGVCFVVWDTQQAIDIIFDDR